MLRQLLQEGAPIQTMMWPTDTETQGDQESTRSSSSTPSTRYSPTTPSPDHTASPAYQADLAFQNICEDPKEENAEESVNQLLQFKEEVAHHSPISPATVNSSDEDPDDTDSELHDASFEWNPSPAELAQLTIREFQVLAQHATPEQVQFWRTIRTREKRRLCGLRARAKRRLRQLGLKEEVEELRETVKQQQRDKKKMARQLRAHRRAHSARRLMRVASRYSERLRQIQARRNQM